VASVYARDLDSSIARTWGFGGSFTFSPPGSRLSASVAADRWEEPASAEYGAGRRCWNAGGEVRVPLARQFGLVVSAGHKTAGFLPGRPVPEGNYFGAGALLSLW